MTYDRNYAVVQSNGKVRVQTNSLARAEQYAAELREEGMYVRVEKSDGQAACSDA